MKATAAAGFLRESEAASSRLVTKALSQDVTLLVFVPLPALRSVSSVTLIPKESTNWDEDQFIYVEYVLTKCLPTFEFYRNTFTFITQLLSFIYQLLSFIYQLLNFIDIHLSSFIYVTNHPHLLVMIQF
ncbi:hypothetical protein LSPCS325_03730 [Lysinibacillus sp. CTST325]